MTDINIPALEDSMNGLRGILKDALVSADVWQRGTGLSLVSHNSNPVAVALFNEVTRTLLEIDSRFPGCVTGTPWTFKMTTSSWSPSDRT